MKKQSLSFLGVGLVAAMAATAPAAVITLTDVIGDPVSTDAAPGSTFQVRVRLTLNAGEDALAYSFRLLASQSDIFTITDRTLASDNPFTDLTASLTGPGLNPSNGFDLGGTTGNGLTRPAGTYNLYTMTLAVSPGAAAGPYQISVVEGAVFDVNYDTINTTPASYLVAVPEPVVLGMLSMASGGLLIRRRAPKAK